MDAYCHLLKVKEGRHNLKSQIKVGERNLEYEEAEAQAKSRLQYSPSMEADRDAKV